MEIDKRKYQVFEIVIILVSGFQSTWTSTSATCLKSITKKSVYSPNRFHFAKKAIDFRIQLNMSSNGGDHREQNILLAKNLNQVKVNLRNKKKDLLALQSKLRFEQQRNSRLETEQVTILNRIDNLKKQLDETFLKNTYGYINLSKQLDQMHHESFQTVDELSVLGVTNASVVNTCRSESTFLKNIKRLSESMASDELFGYATTSNNTTFDSTRPPVDLHSLSFNTFASGLNSTFVQDSNDDSVLDQTFLAQAEQHKEQTPLSEIMNFSNVTVRKMKTEKLMKTEESKIRAKLSHKKENQSMATESDMKTFALRRGSRMVRKIDYNETSMRRKK